jgi:D-3-phosphoglycerate dehydrogenase
MQSQFVKGQIKEVQIEYIGDFHKLDLSPVTTSFIKGLLDPLVQDGVNPINAPILANEMGITISVSSTAESDEFSNLISAKVITTESECAVAGTVFGKTDARIVRIDDFRIEIIPQGSLALIHNLDQPGAIGSIGNKLGENNINISGMQVGRELGGEHNIILIRTDSPVPENVIQAILALPKVKTIKTFEL